MIQTPQRSSRRAPAQRSRMAELLDALAVREGLHATAVPGVQLARDSQPSPRKPRMTPDRHLTTSPGQDEPTTH